MTAGSLLDAFRGLPVLVVGDVMLDEYHFGRATRISPEAPVMVIRHERTAHLPGGAANVALNVQALGGSPTLLGLAGRDAAGDDLEQCLKNSTLRGCHLVRSSSRQTTRKMRIVADHSHQVLRMDTEDDRPSDQASENELVSQAEKALDECRVMILSDYLKGALTSSVVERVVAAARAKSVAVVANPKPRSLSQYRGIDLISLNRLEAAEALGLHSGLDPDKACDAAEELRIRLDAKGLLLTLGEAGMAAAGEGGAFRLAAPRVEVYDTAGAGDTVIATVALGLAAAGFRKEVFELAIQTSACVVRHVGVATPSENDLAAIRSVDPA